ncbi:MAG TPA: O-antigen ligase family protein [Cyclobacteriaceae bacterium]|nr:O-antigen ligase family protein [Cyclobacteriaceae bacterium]
MKKVFYWSMLLFIFSIPISSYVSTKLLVIVFVISLLTKASGKRSLALEMRKSWDILAFLLILIIGLINTDDIETGFKVLETSFSLLALLVVFTRLNKSEGLVSHIFISFMSGLLVACLISLGTAGVSFIGSGNFQDFFYYQLTEVIQLHPTYLAYYLIASITYIVYIIFYNLEKKRMSAWIAIVFFFFLMLVLTGGRTTYVSLLLIFSFFILKYILENKTKEKAIVFSVVLILLVSLFAINSTTFFNLKFSQHSDYWERSILWKSAILANPNPLQGVGTGDYKTVLNEYYQSHGMKEYAIDSFNSHNQFIQVYFSNGVIGLIFLLLLIGRPIYLSMKSQNILGILLLFPFVIYGVTEVFLGRYQGVVFFALLHQIVIYQHYSSKPSFALDAS